MYAARMQLVRHVIEPNLKPAIGCWRAPCMARAYQGGDRLSRSGSRWCSNAARIQT